MSKRNNSGTINFKQSLDEYLTLKKVLEKYDLKLKNLRKMRSGFKLETDKGDYHLKISRYSEKDVLFTYYATEYLYKKGFKHINRFYQSRENTPYVWEDGKIYFVTNWVNGKECDIGDIHMIERVTKLMAYFHLFARGFYPSGQISDVRQEWGSWRKRFVDRLEQLKNFKDVLKEKKHKERFDRRFLKYVDYFVEQGTLAIKDLNCDYFYRLVERSKKELHFCHRDFIPNNIIIGRENQITLIDFDNCAAEIQLDDLGKFMRRVKDMDIDKARFIIETYHKINPLCSDDIKLLASYLRFPLEFWTLTRRHYETGRHSSKALKRLVDSADTWESFVDILEITDFSYLRHIKAEINLELLMDEIEGELPMREYQMFSKKIFGNTEATPRGDAQDIYAWGEISFDSAISKPELSPNLDSSNLNITIDEDEPYAEHINRYTLSSSDTLKEDERYIPEEPNDTKDDGYSRDEVIARLVDEINQLDTKIQQISLTKLEAAMEYDYFVKAEAAATRQDEQTTSEEIATDSFEKKFAFDTEGKIIFGQSNEIEFSVDDFGIDYEAPRQDIFKTDTREIDAIFPIETDSGSNRLHLENYEPEEEYLCVDENDTRSDDRLILQGGIDLNSEVLEKENSNQLTDTTILDDADRELKDTIDRIDEVLDDTNENDTRSQENDDEFKVFFIKGEKEQLERTVEEIEKLFGEDRQKAIEAILEKNKLEVESCEDRIEPGQTVPYDENIIIPQIEKEERLGSLEDSDFEASVPENVIEQNIRIEQNEFDSPVLKAVEAPVDRPALQVDTAAKTANPPAKGVIVWKKFPKPLGS